MGVGSSSVAALGSFSSSSLSQIGPLSKGSIGGLKSSFSCLDVSSRMMLLKRSSGNESTGAAGFKGEGNGAGGGGGALGTSGTGVEEDCSGDMGVETF